MSKKVRCAGCGNQKEKVCSNCWRCKICCSCSEKGKRHIDGYVGSHNNRKK
jgi:hypothetical protein